MAPSEERFLAAMRLGLAALVAIVAATLLARAKTSAPQAKTAPLLPSPRQHPSTPAVPTLKAKSLAVSERAATSQQWGQAGELWSPQSRIPDFSYAGYMGESGWGPACRHRCTICSTARTGTITSWAQYATPHAAGERSVPVYPVRFSVRTFGAAGDNTTGRHPCAQPAWIPSAIALLPGATIHARTSIPATSFRHILQLFARPADDSDAFIRAIAAASAAAANLSAVNEGQGHSTVSARFADWRSIGGARQEAGKGPPPPLTSTQTWELMQSCASSTVCCCSRTMALATRGAMAWRSGCRQASTASQKCSRSGRCVRLSSAGTREGWKSLFTFMDPGGTSGMRARVISM